jgi:hypothetical protein
MSNPYYSNSHNIGAGGFGRGDQLDEEFQRIEEAFDDLAAVVGGSFEIVNNADSPVAAVAGGSYFVDLSSGAVTITLPAAPTIADAPIAIVVLGSIANALTVDRNGKPIMSLAENLSIDIANWSGKLAFADNTFGWRIIGI